MSLSFLYFASLVLAPDEFDNYFWDGSPPRRRLTCRRRRQFRRNVRAASSRPGARRLVQDWTEFHEIYSTRDLEEHAGRYGVEPAEIVAAVGLGWFQ